MSVIEIAKRGFRWPAWASPSLVQYIEQQPFEVSEEWVRNFLEANDPNAHSMEAVQSKSAALYIPGEYQIVAEGTATGYETEYLGPSLDDPDAHKRPANEFFFGNTEPGQAFFAGGTNFATGEFTPVGSPNIPLAQQINRDPSSGEPSYTWVVPQDGSVLPEDTTAVPGLDTGNLLWLAVIAYLVWRVMK